MISYHTNTQIPQANNKNATTIAQSGCFFLIYEYIFDQILFCNPFASRQT